MEEIEEILEKRHKQAKQLKESRIVIETPRGGEAVHPESVLAALSRHTTHRIALDPKPHILKADALLGALRTVGEAREKYLELLKKSFGGEEVPKVDVRAGETRFPIFFGRLGDYSFAGTMLTMGGSEADEDRLKARGRSTIVLLTDDGYFVHGARSEILSTIEERQQPLPTMGVDLLFDGRQVRVVRYSRDGKKRGEEEIPVDDEVSEAVKAVAKILGVKGIYANAEYWHEVQTLPEILRKIYTALGGKGDTLIMSGVSKTFGMHVEKPHTDHAEFGHMLAELAEALILNNRKKVQEVLANIRERWGGE